MSSSYDSDCSSNSDSSFDEDGIPKAGTTLKTLPLGSFAGAQFDKVYQLVDRLNSGSYGTVFKTIHVTDPDKFYAVKILNRKFHKHKDASVLKEVEIMQRLSGVENITQLVDFYVDDEKMYVVQDLAEGGDVFDRLVNRTKYTEKDARGLADILLTACQSLHFRKIVHRDLKPENLLLKDKFDDSTILLCDFGLATYLPKDRQKGLKTRCGTPAFMAPEIVIKKEYREAVDMWSVGCLLFMLVGGYQPFQAQNDVKLFQKIRAGDFVFHDKFWGKVNLEIKKLIAGLLTVNPHHRWTADQSIRCGWMKQKRKDDKNKDKEGEGEEEEYADLTDALEGIRSYKAKRRLKGAMSAVRWTASMKFFKSNSVTFSRKELKKDDSATSAGGGMNGLPGRGGGRPSLLMAGRGGAASQKQSSPLDAFMEEKVSFHNTYDLAEKIAQSARHKIVHKCYHKRSREPFACKLQIRTGSGQRDEEIMNEVAIMQTLSIYDKYIVPLVDFYEEEDCFYMVMDYEEGGDLFDRLVVKRQYTELDARDLIRALLKGVQHMHEHGIAHRDLKPQNLLLTKKDNDIQVRLTGFRFAKRVHTPQSLTQRVGTPIYVAPEVLKNIPHDERVDLWSVGVIAYVLLVGYPPFMDDSQAVLFQKIRTGKYAYYGEDWDPISPEAKNLIDGLLVVDPVERWSVDRALKCRWFQMDDDAHNLSGRDLSVANKKMTMRRSLLRKLSQTVLWNKEGKGDPNAPPVPADERDHDDDDDDDEKNPKRVSIIAEGLEGVDLDS